MQHGNLNNMNGNNPHSQAFPLMNQNNQIFISDSIVNSQQNPFMNIQTTKTKDLNYMKNKRHSNSMVSNNSKINCNPMNQNGSMMNNNVNMNKVRNSNQMMNSNNFNNNMMKQNQSNNMINSNHNIKSKNMNQMMNSNNNSMMNMNNNQNSKIQQQMMQQQMMQQQMMQQQMMQRQMMQQQMMQQQLYQQSMMAQQKKMQDILQNQMLSKMQNNNKSSNNSQYENSNIINIVFNVSGDKDITALQINILIDINEKVSTLIQNYRDKAQDFEKMKKFIFNAKELNPSLSCEESGLCNNSVVHVINTRNVDGGFK